MEEVEEAAEVAEVVEVAGEFSVRGGILDVFPPDASDPVRVEFFGDEVESIRPFDAETQRSLDYNSQKDYREKYEKEMQEIRDLEIWRAGKAVRSLRPENQK